MTADPSRENFYAELPVFRGFANVVDQDRYRPLPDDWLIGIADVADSTKAVQENRYKTVNMAGAAVIVAVTNALRHRDFPFVFGGDGASFAVPPSAGDIARDALAATAAWVKDELDLTLRIGLVPVSAARAEGTDVRVARYGASDNVALAMFSGGGLAWADAAMKQGRFEEIPAVRGLILSILVMPVAVASPDDVRRVIEAVIGLTERNPDASGPIPQEPPRLRWPPQGLDLEARAHRRAGESLAVRKAKILVWTLLGYLIIKLGIRVGKFSPQKYMKEVVENSDFRKFDDTLRMVIDCTPALADEIERMLVQAAGTVRFGLHRQDKAMVTCFTPSPIQSDHVHFIDGALGGYTTAAMALKAS